MLEWAWRQQLKYDAKDCVLALVETLQRLAGGPALPDLDGPDVVDELRALARDGPQ